VAQDEPFDPYVDRPVSAMMLVMHDMDHIDPAHQGKALLDRLLQIQSYREGQQAVAELRKRKSGPPWPEEGNPMVDYLIARAVELAEEGGAEAAIAWAVVNTWRESAIDVHARYLDATTRLTSGLGEPVE
jgi:hypothetical protein